MGADSKELSIKRNLNKIITCLLWNRRNQRSRTWIIRFHKGTSRKKRNSPRNCFSSRNNETKQT